MRTILRLGLLTALTVVVWDALKKSDNDEDSEDSGSSSDNSEGSDNQQ